MSTVFLVCALVGAVLLVAQLVMGAAGLDGTHADFHPDVHEPGGDAHDALHFLSLRAVAAGLAFGGLAGWGLLAALHHPFIAAFGALVAGSAAVVGVALAMQALLKLRGDGSVQPGHTLGATGTVYIPIPGGVGEPGKVLLTVQGRTVEIAAVSPTPLATGQPVTVVGLLGSSCVEVVPSPTVKDLLDV
jgi:hypothetical protein